MSTPRSTGRILLHFAWRLDQSLQKMKKHFHLHAISPSHLLNQWSFSARLDRLPTEERRRRIPQVQSICSIGEAPVQDLITFQQKKKKNSACIIPKSMFSDSSRIRWSSISRRRVIMWCYSGCQASLSISYYRTCFCHVFPSSVPPWLDLLSGWYYGAQEASWRV